MAADEMTMPEVEKWRGPWRDPDYELLCSCPREFRGHRTITIGWLTMLDLGTSSCAAGISDETPESENPCQKSSEQTRAINLHVMNEYKGISWMAHLKMAFHFSIYEPNTIGNGGFTECLRHSAKPPKH
jgi:hypothetical protein